MISKIAFIDIEFHKKTKSSDFFKKLLVDYDIDFFWEDFQKTHTKEYLDKSYDLYIYWQFLPTFKDLIKIKDKKILLIPMYDSISLNKLYRHLYKGFNVKILCFCKKMYDFFSAEGFDCLYVQYFLPPLNLDVDYSSKKVFFWHRGNITREMVKKVLGDQDVEITIKDNPDPKYKKLQLTDEDTKKYKVSFLNTFFNTKEEYFKYLAKHNIFIAPRKQEGIGMSFLESMSIGQCIIAYNDATMNEYMGKQNGYLSFFDKEVDLDNHEIVGRNCKKAYLEGYNKRLSGKKEIIKFMFSDYPSLKQLSPFSIKLYSILFEIIKIRRSILNIINKVI